MKKILFVFVMFFVCIGFVNAESSYYSKMWEQKQGNTGTFVADQVMETKDGYLIAGYDEDGLSLRLVDDYGQKIKDIIFDDITVYGIPFKILYKDNKYHILMFSNDYYFYVLTIDENYNFVDIKEHDVEGYPLFSYNTKFLNPFFFEEDDYYYISSGKVSKDFSQVTTYGPDELAEVISRNLNLDENSIDGFLGSMNSDSSVFLRNTSTNRILGSVSYCGSVVLGAAEFYGPGETGTTITRGVHTRGYMGACYNFYTIEDNDMKILYGSNKEVVYDAIEYAGNIVALVFDVEEEEIYMVVFDWEGNELSRENLNNYGVVTPGAAYLNSTSNGFVLVNRKSGGSCGSGRRKAQASGSFSLNRCYYTNLTYFSPFFKVATKSDGNGDITVEKIRVSTGEAVKFTVTPKPGYVLNVVKVIDSNGNVLTFKNNTFVMPASDVIVEASFSPINPLTSTGGIIWTIITLMLLAIFVGLKFRKRLHWLN